MAATDVLTLTPAGLYCVPGDFHIDPTRRVPRALITHGHSDHARAGHDAVMATRETLAIMALRYGEGFARTQQAAGLGEKLTIGDATVSFHPAGHVLGSAQIAIAAKGTRIVVSGDYKRTPDPTCRAFEPVACDLFITEATFGLPVFRHPDVHHEIGKFLASVALFPERAHLLGAYTLGKAQRIVALIREAGYDRPIYIHGAAEKLMDFYAREGIALGDIRKVPLNERGKLGGEIVIVPPGALNDLWSRKFPDPVTAFASGWMRIRARARQHGVTLPLVISDHADWDGLCATIGDTGCSEVWVTHGEEDALVHWAKSQGLDAQPLHMLGYGDEEEDEGGSAAPEGVA
jgi:putative mRNA 3-end processing factor